MCFEALRERESNQIGIPEWGIWDDCLDLRIGVERFAFVVEREIWTVKSVELWKSHEGKAKQRI